MESGGSSLVVVQGLLAGVASLVLDYGLCGAWASIVAACGLSSCSSQALEHRLNSCGTQTYLFHDMWNLPRSGIKPVSLALVREFFTTEPQGSPIVLINKFRTIIIAVEN